MIGGDTLKSFFQEFKALIFIILSLPLGLIMYIVYANVVTFLDPVLTLIFGGGFLLFILSILFWIFINLKDFVVSIFKKDDTRDERGFKKHF